MLKFRLNNWLDYRKFVLKIGHTSRVDNYWTIIFRVLLLAYPKMLITHSKDTKQRERDIKKGESYKKKICVLLIF
jgi:hypothetical protein